jgi:hypothetical protein
MRKLMAATIIIVSCVAFLPAAATAQERVNDAVMGGVAGLLVGGPIGLVAGGLIGYNAGPTIASGMGVRHRDYYDEPRRSYRRPETRRDTHNAW